MKKKIKKICLVGLGFVGSAMLVSIASRIGNKYKIVGIEKNNLKGNNIIKKLNKGFFPISTNDKNILDLCKLSSKKKLYYCTTDYKELNDTDIVLIEINLDIKNISSNKPSINLDQYLRSFKKILLEIKTSPLIIIQTTVPPGFTDKYLKPLILSNLSKNNINNNKILLSFSYERVMPGKKYLDSIINNWRVIGSINKRSEKMTKLFFQSFVNSKKYPITILPNILSAEMAKIIEYSYRAANIAFIEEWSRFSEILNIDIYKIINAIKIRPSHRNIAKPGLGVGGYCLTKDPLFGVISDNLIFKNKLSFPISTTALKINNSMPSQTVKLIQNNSINLKNKKVLIFGLSYKEDVGDLRYSPSITLAKKLKKLGSKVIFYDPLINKNINFKEFKLHNKKLPNLKNIDLLIFAVPHKNFSDINFKNYIINKKITVLDSFNVLQNSQIKLFKKIGVKLISIGRGNV